MWYIVWMVVIGSFMVWDTGRRHSTARIGWTFWAMLFAIVIVPFWLAKRPLLANEVREGGTGWNVLKYFVVLWTFFCFVMAVVGMGAAASTMSTTSDQWESAGAAIGTAIGMGMIAALWFFPTFAALVIGLFLRKNSIVERGPSPEIANGAAGTITLPS